MQPAGETGSTTLLTNLANHVQPLIRYDLGDRVVVRSEPCPCGSTLPVIEVQGRCDDTLWFESSGGRRVAVLPLALTTVLEVDAELFDFQLEQTGPRALRLRCALQGETADLALRRGHDALTAMLARHGLAGVQVRLRSGVPNRRGPGGKVRRVVALPAQARAPGGG